MERRILLAVAIVATIVVAADSLVWLHVLQVNGDETKMPPEF